MATSTRTPSEAVREWFARFDVEGAGELMHDDCKRYGVGRKGPWDCMDKATYLEMWSGFRSAFPDVFEWELTSLMESGNTVAAEFIESGTWTGPYPVGPGFTLPPTKTSYRDHDAAWFEVDDDGLITEVRAYITNDFETQYQVGKKVAAVLALTPKA